MTGPGERIPEESEKMTPEELRVIIKKFGLRALDTFVVTYMEDDDFERKKVPRSAVFPLDEIGICDAPLKSMPDEMLRIYLVASESRLGELSQDPKAMADAVELGEKKIQELREKNSQE